MNKISLTSIALFLCIYVSAQTSRISSYEKIKQEWSPVNEIKFRNIGPTVMSGRVTDIEVNPADPHEFYVAYASGGLWHTTNNGQSMQPIFDHEASMTIGDIAVNWSNRTIWVGTGEANSSRSSYAGVGVYVSTDAGKTWKHRGLDESHHISKIILHPANTQIAWASVIGHLYTNNTERGIYKTTDGGATWKQTLYINDSTGCIDLEIDPQHPDIMYTAAWTRSRKPWNFVGNGSGSALYKSKDGGNHWTVISTAESGFPSGKHTGRIGLAVCDKNSEVLYAIVDNQANQPEQKNENSSVKKISARELEKMSKNDFLNMDEKSLSEYLQQNAYPEKYNAASLKKSVTRNEFSVKDIADWKLADADAGLFDTPIVGAELYRSNDGGQSWQKTHSDILEGVFFTYGYYFGTLQVSPQNADKVMIAGYPLLMSEDGGRNFKQIDGDNCHPDYHSIWIDPKDDQHIITGNDGGVNISYDNGQNWYKANNPAVGQFYAIQVDNAEPYNVYGGLQDNGTWTGPSNHTESTAWHQDGAYGFKNIGGGDGMQVQVDTRDNETFYAGYQFGNYYRANKNSDHQTDVRPVHDIGQKPFRFNWQTPILLSRHNQDIFYLGSNCLHRSLQKGADMQTISGDLTMANHKGNIPFNTITCISESPLRFGVLYAGTDDGLVQCSKDGGYTWDTVLNRSADGMWVTRICASKYKAGRIYASLNLYRKDVFDPILYASDDFGKRWKTIGTNLPQEPVNVIREDPKDENILYAGTDNGLYVSFDRGAKFVPWISNLPRVAIHDIAIQERENEIVLGTHGRSIYIAKLDHIQAYNKVKNLPWAMLDTVKVKYNERLGNKPNVWSEPARHVVGFYFYTATAGIYHVKISSAKAEVLFTGTQTCSKGINYFEYDLALNTNISNVNAQALKKRDDGKYYLPPGKYDLEFTGPDAIKHRAAFEILKRGE